MSEQKPKWEPISSLPIGMPVLLKNPLGRLCVQTIYGPISQKTYKGIYECWADASLIDELLVLNQAEALSES